MHLRDGGAKSRYSSPNAASTTRPDRGCGRRLSAAVHVALSLIGIAAGFVVMVGLLRGAQLRGWTAVFLVATSVTDYGFPVDRVRPSHVVGALSLVVLAIAILALYGL
jgi:hypothetical protein